MSEALPNDVKEFIAENIHSVAQLEVLLAMHREPDRLWTTEEVTSFLFLSHPMVRGLLDDLVRRGFAVEQNAAYRYQPAKAHIPPLVDRLAGLYHERRVAVTTEIFSKPIDVAKAFADAFRLRKES